jgi:hypothetical protein
VRSMVLLIGAGVLLASASQASSDSVRSLKKGLSSYHVFSGSKAKAFPASSGSQRTSLSTQKSVQSHLQQSVQSHRDGWRRLIKLGTKKTGGLGCWVVVHQPTPAPETPGTNTTETTPDPPEIVSTPYVPDTTADDPLLPPGPETSTPVAAVPLPAALPLFAGGLGLMGWMARRRRKALCLKKFKHFA